MKRPNPLPPDRMTAAERRAELCGLLALGLVRLQHRGPAATICRCWRKLPTLSARRMPSCNSNSPEKTMTTHDPIPARLAALKTATTPELKAQWRDLFDSEPPPFNRRYLESRLAYRIQELAYGGLKPETIRRLERLGEELDGGRQEEARHPRRPDRPSPAHGCSANGRAWSMSSPSPPTGSNGRGGPTSRSPPSRARSPARAGTAGCSSA